MIYPYDRFHCKCYTPEIHQIQNLKFLGTNSNWTNISIWIYTARYWEILSFSMWWILEVQHCQWKLSYLYVVSMILFAIIPSCLWCYMHIMSNGRCTGSGGRVSSVCGHVLPASRRGDSAIFYRPVLEYSFFVSGNRQPYISNKKPLSFAQKSPAILPKEPCISIKRSLLAISAARFVIGCLLICLNLLPNKILLKKKADWK